MLSATIIKKDAADALKPSTYELITVPLSLTLFNILIIVEAVNTSPPGELM